MAEKQSDYLDSFARLSRRNLLKGGAGLAVATCLPRRSCGQVPGLSVSTLTTEAYVTVEIADGKLRGGQSRGALAFKGIPYGGSVSGNNRFKPAGPVEPWTGVRDALVIGTPAYQSPHTVYGEHEAAPGEECLVLNVWTPSIDHKKRPVIFYNHGGGFQTGSAGSVAQDGAQLAANHDVVVVASNHRLGIMGYLCLDEIGGDAFAGSGNAGMLDILLALEWVHKNISAFGGDPNNVMIFGESGGGAKTAALMAMPGAEGRFHKAGVMSGPMRRVTEKSKAAAVALAVLDLLGIRKDELQKLAEVPVEQFFAIQNGGHGPNGVTKPLPGGFGPMLDGHFIAQNPFDPLPASFVKQIPLLIGTNRDEATLFFEDNPDIFKMDEAAVLARLRSDMGAEKANAVWKVFKEDRPQATPVELFIAISTNGMWGETIQEAESKLRQRGAPVYMYRYDYQSNHPIKGTDWTLRAGHATDIASKFENPDIPGLMGTKPDRFQASKNFGEVWTSFARTGRPHAPGIDVWPAYDLNTRATALIDVNCSLTNDPDKPERELFQRLAGTRR